MRCIGLITPARRLLPPGAGPHGSGGRSKVARRLALTNYELILMLDPQAADEQRDAIASTARGKLESQGTLDNEATWGLRKMAYEIDRRGEADYRYFRFSGEKALLDDLGHSLKITDGVLRFRIFKVDPESPMIVPPDTEVIMRRDEEDDRGRGRGRGGDRGPRRPRDDDSSDADGASRGGGERSYS